jgi:hypothetical protein
VIRQTAYFLHQPLDDPALVLFRYLDSSGTARVACGVWRVACCATGGILTRCALRDQAPVARVAWRRKPSGKSSRTTSSWACAWRTPGTGPASHTTARTRSHTGRRTRTTAHAISPLAAAHAHAAHAHAADGAVAGGRPSARKIRRSWPTSGTRAFASEACAPYAPTP